MFQFHVVSGKMAGREIPVRHFPFSVGRADTNNLVLEEKGVWNTHLTLTMDGEACRIDSVDNAAMAINGKSASGAELRSGDLIELGAVKLRFSLSPRRPCGLRVREASIWSALAAVFAFEFWLIYRLLD